MPDTVVNHPSPSSPHPDWWPTLSLSSRLEHLHDGYRCPHCQREFVVNPDRRGRMNLGWLRSGAERHAIVCDEIHKIAGRLRIDRKEARRLRARWVRAQNRERSPRKRVNALPRVSPADCRRYRP